MSTHARLSPSNARWPNCAGSVREESGYMDVAGAAAIDGTGSHLLLEMCFDNGVPAIVYDGQIIGANHEDNPQGWLVDPERIDRVQICLDYVTRRHNELKVMYPNSEVVVESESKSDVGGMFGRDDWKGTCDVTITCRNKHTGEVYFIEVVDYKDGRGYVHTKDNTQLLAYLGGKMRLYIGSGPEKVRPFQIHRIGGCRMTIVQPKTSRPIRYECSVEGDFSPTYALDKIIELDHAADAADKDDAPVKSGKWCQWCKANPKRGGHCTAATEKSIATVTNMTDGLIPTIPLDGELSLFDMVKQVTVDPTSLSSDQLGQLIDAAPPFIDAFKKCEEELAKRITNGDKVSGWGMLAGNNKRVWNLPDDEIVKKLKSRRLKDTDIYPRKLVSPAAALRLTNLTDKQRDKIEADLISTVEGKLTLKRVAHSDTKVVQSATEMFAEVEKPLDFF